MQEILTCPLCEAFREWRLHKACSSAATSTGPSLRQERRVWFHGDGHKTSGEVIAKVMRRVQPSSPPVAGPVPERNTE